MNGDRAVGEGLCERTEGDTRSHKGLSTWVSRDQGPQS